jgi:two-component system phosphate regulon sensor histidine kinase PhoR
MFLQPRFISFLLALAIAISTAAFCSLVPKTPAITIATTFLVAIASSFLLIYFTIEYLIFKELISIHAIFEKLKKKEFRIQKESGGFKINPIKKLNNEIALFAMVKQKEIEELKKIESYRKEFIADLSHELKTPIFAAQGYIHTLLDGAKDDPEVSEKFLKKAAKSLDGLDELVQDLLDLSEIETRSAKMRKDYFDIFQVVGEAFDQLEKKALKKNIVLLSERSVEKPIMVEADQKRIFQVILNLVENGIKYGQEGGFVKVYIQQEKESADIQVVDNGPGIPEEDQKRVFERFYRVEKSRSKDKGGSGLGLAICREIIEAHKSKITLASKPGKGSTFSFRLPVKKENKD